MVGDLCSLCYFNYFVFVGFQFRFLLFLLFFVRFLEKRINQLWFGHGGDLLVILRVISYEHHLILGGDVIAYSLR